MVMISVSKDSILPRYVQNKKNMVILCLYLNDLFS